ncbi:MAG TPA: aminoglycoside phosphotransferase family protein, partial [Verrucomicrobiae bacterium]|nr:aminoglycoside phosphotransferase family protein [Verrucomicrobiae bacterium]
MKPQLLETQQIEAFLSKHLGSDVQEVSPIGRGSWSQAFSFSHSDTDFVARFGVHIEDFLKDEVASKFATADLPVPKVLEVGEALERYFCISERAYGEMLEGLPEDKMRETVPAVLRMLDGLRDTDVSSTAGFGLWHADGNAPQKSWAEFLLDVDNETERVHGWHANMAQFPDVVASYDEILGYLKSHLNQCPEIRHLLHTDLLHFNVMVGDGKINAVVDWGNSMYGDFLYELAAFTFYAP